MKRQNIIIAACVAGSVALLSFARATGSNVAVRSDASTYSTGTDQGGGHTTNAPTTSTATPKEHHDQGKHEGTTGAKSGTMNPGKGEKKHEHHGEHHKSTSANP